MERTIIDYLYEKAVKLGGAEGDVPRTVASALSPIIRPIKHGHQDGILKVTVGAKMAHAEIVMSKANLSLYIHLLTHFEKNTKPLTKLALDNTSSLAWMNLSFSRYHLAGKFNDDAEPNYMKVCVNNRRLFELCDFLYHCKDEFAAIMRLYFTKVNPSVDLHHSGLFGKRVDFEFAVCLSSAVGIDMDLMTEAVNMSPDELTCFLDARCDHVDDMKRRWSELCLERRYDNDFSRLLHYGPALIPNKVVLFAMDGVHTYNEII